MDNIRRCLEHSRGSKNPRVESVEKVTIFTPELVNGFFVFCIDPSDCFVIGVTIFRKLQVAVGTVEAVSKAISQDPQTNMPRHYLHLYLANQTRSVIFCASDEAESLTAANAAVKILFLARSTAISSDSDREDGDPAGDTVCFDGIVTLLAGM